MPESAQPHPRGRRSGWGGKSNLAAFPGLPGASGRRLATLLARPLHGIWLTTACLASISSEGVTRARRQPSRQVSWTTCREWKYSRTVASRMPCSLPFYGTHDPVGVAGGAGSPARRRVLVLPLGLRPLPDPRSRLPWIDVVPGLVCLDRPVVEGVLVFALQDVSEHRAGIVMQ